MNVIINNRFRRMAQATGDRCHLPLFVSSDPSLHADFIDLLKSIYPDQELKIDNQVGLSSVWVDLPANTVFQLGEVNDQGYSPILAANNKLEDVDWEKNTVYVQLGHFEPLPERYQVQQATEAEGYQIYRFNFRYNYYVPMHKLPVFSSEHEAKEYILSQLSDWEIG